MAGLPVSWVRNGMACGKEMLLQGYFVEQQKQTCVLVKLVKQQGKAETDTPLFLAGRPLGYSA